VKKSGYSGAAVAGGVLAGGALGAGAAYLYNRESKEDEIANIEA
jgi:hypothetical protein